MRCIFTFFIFCLLSCKNETTKPAKSMRSHDTFHLMIQTGLPEIERNNQINFLAKKYGVRYYNIGCVTEKFRLDSIKKINDSISVIVASRFGKNWLQNLRAEFETARRVEEIAYTEILNRQIHHNEVFYYLVMPGIKKGEYVVKVYSIDYETDKAQIRTHYHMRIDYRKRSVLEVSKMPI